MRILTDAGAQVSDVPNAEAAMSQIRAAAPDVLVSDIGMAQLDGYQLMRNCARGLRRERLPAIALTAFSRMQDRADALAAGFQAHLPKPVKAEALVSAVATLTRRNNGDSPRFLAKGDSHRGRCVAPDDCPLLLIGDCPYFLPLEKERVSHTATVTSTVVVAAPSSSGDNSSANGAMHGQRARARPGATADSCSRSRA